MPGEEDQAFDARKIWMSESDEDLTQWRLVSLVTALRAVLLQGPEGDGDGPVSRVCPDGERRVAFLGDVMDELTDRGIDADSLVRYGLIAEVLAPVLATLVVLQLLNAKDAALFERERSTIDVEGWRQVFGLTGERAHAFEKVLEDPAELEAAIKRVLSEALHDVSSALGPVVSWVFTAPIKDVLTLRPPRVTELEELLVTDPVVDHEVILEYRWVVERFSTTFFGQWSTKSLHLEYLWIQGLGTPPCAVNLMQERSIARHSLESEITRRTVLEKPVGPTTDRLAMQVQNHAKSFLAEGRFREAAALFEFVCREQPDNAEALNNLGFCLIPESPKVALEHLEKANRLGYSPQVINVYNRMCCHIAGGRLRAAVREAERYWDEPGEANAVAATLWCPGTEAGWILRGVHDARGQLSVLAEYASKLDDERRALRPGSVPDDLIDTEPND